MTLHRLRSLLVLVAPVALSFALLAAPARADQPDDKDASASKPAQADAAAANDQPATAAADKNDEAAEPKGAKVSPEAQKVIEQVEAAYGKLKSLELAGTLSENIQASGEDLKATKKFTASYVAPNKFRHAMEDDIVIGSTGTKAYGYLQTIHLYSQADAPKEKVELARLPEPIPQTLQTQNPSLMFAVVKSASAELKDTFSDIQKVADVQLDGLAFQSLQLTLPNKSTVTMLVHPETHLLRQVRYDVKPLLEQRGTPDVKQAVLTVDYTSVKPDAPVKEELFAWAPPQAARDTAEFKGAQAAAPGGDDNPAAALEGKDAPDFRLKDLEGKEVALKDLKGKVVVLDMWATWCPPCRASLPHLDKLYSSVKDKGVHVFAVNLKEDKEDVEQFIKNNKLSLPVLLDTDGSVARSYLASGIPETIVIGKDGKVAKVFVGFDPQESPTELKEAVQKAMK